MSKVKITIILQVDVADFQSNIQKGLNNIGERLLWEDDEGNIENLLDKSQEVLTDIDMDGKVGDRYHYLIKAKKLGPKDRLFQ